MADTLVMVGTRKGLWIGRSDEARRDWSWTGPHFAMEEVYSCLVDTRGDRPRLLAGASSSWLGPAGLALRRPRRDLAGDAERRRPLPRGHRRGRRPGVAADARAPRTASCTPAPSPARSSGPTDRGETFQLERGLWDNPQRKEWNAGYGGQAFHTILPHPEDAARRCSRRSPPAASTAPTTAATRGTRPTPG